jgi:hypothetical protein
MIRAIVMLALFLSPMALRAENGLSAAQKPECTRPDLQKAVDQYLNALKEGKPSQMTLASGAKYIENRKETPLGRGIWQTPLDIDFHRSLLDVEQCETYTEIIRAKGSHPYVIGTRLKIAGNRISEIEALVTDKNDWLFNAAKYLKYSSQEKWDILPPAQRVDRQTLINVANAYFNFFADRSSQVPWNVPCARLEGGMYTNEAADPDATCTKGPPLEGTLQITNRRFIVDLDMGTVVGLVDFGEKKGPFRSHAYGVSQRLRASRSEKGGTV